MAKTHWREIKQTDYLGGHDLADGKGGHSDINVTITKAVREQVTSTDGDKTTELVLHFKEHKKPMILNVTNAKMLEKLLRSSYIEDWVGATITVGTERVKAFGEWHDALRIRKTLPRVRPTEVIPCSVCGKPIEEHRGAPVGLIIERSVAELGQPTCIPCWNEMKENVDSDNDNKETPNEPNA